MISIVIPVWNQAEKIKDCLDSILNQTILNSDIFAIEVIVVNDGSTDNIDEVMGAMKQKFLDKSLQFTYITQANQGPNPARNRGAAEAKGEFIIFCDADIIMEPGMLKIMKDALDTNPAASFAYSSFMWGSKKFRLWEYDEKKLKEMPYIHTTSLIRKEYFPGFDPGIRKFQDWDLWLTMLGQGHRGIWIDEVLYSVKTGGTMSNWLPSFAYKFLPFLPAVKKYNEAVCIIKRKHGL